MIKGFLRGDYVNLTQEQQNKTEVLETETIHYETEESGDLSFDSGLIVGGFPTSIELDPTTQIAETLQAEGAEATLIALNSGEAEAVRPERGAVYNTPRHAIFSELNQALDLLEGETAVFGYCAGGVYALESNLMERRDSVAFVGSDIPQGMANYEGTMQPETDVVIFYDEKMDGRLDAQNLDVYGTDHIWVETPQNYGEAQVRTADLLTEQKTDEIEKLAEDYDWLESV